MTTIDDLVTALVEAESYPGDKTVPMASTDATEVIRSQLTENTGRHLLDSGSAYGRHWEENQDNPPWEQADFNVDSSFVTHNVYDYMDRRFSRDRSCVALEMALYAFAYSDEYSSTAWLRTQEAFADGILGREFTAPMLGSLGLPDEAVEQVLGVSDELVYDGHGSRDKHNDSAMTYNTYNGEWHGLSQCLQGTNLGGPYAEYVLLQVHGGCDIRGGYTSPRVYLADDCWIPGELFYSCHQCDWQEAESVLGYDNEDLIYQRTIDPGELAEHIDTDGTHPAIDQAYELNEAGRQDGAVFHICGDGQLGNVGFM